MYGSFVSFKEHQVKYLTHQQSLFSGEFNAAEIVLINMKPLFFIRRTIRSSISPPPPPFPITLHTEGPVAPTQGEHLLEPVGSSPEQGVEGWSLRGEEDCNNGAVLKDLPEGRKKTQTWESVQVVLVTRDKFNIIFQIKEIITFIVSFGMLKKSPNNLFFATLPGCAGEHAIPT